MQDSPNEVTLQSMDNIDQWQTTTNREACPQLYDYPVYATRCRFNHLTFNAYLHRVHGVSLHLLDTSVYFKDLAKNNTFAIVMHTIV